MTRPDLFPAAQAVKVFQLPSPLPGEYLKNNVGNPEGWLPKPAKVAEPVVEASGKLPLENLAAGLGYLLAAEVGGVWVYLQARVGGIAGGVSALNINAEMAVKLADSTLVKANPERELIEITNDGANPVYLGLGGAAKLKEGVGPLATGATWNGLVGGKLWLGSVHAITETAEVNVSVREG